MIRNPLQGVSPGGKPNLIMAGFMGTGKSTVGPLVAQRLGMPFLDTDLLVESRAGMRVSEIFARQGEAAFRALERQVCAQVAGCDSCVIALGGGALLDPANRATLEKGGLLVLLTCDTEVLLGRLEASARNGERPLLGSDYRTRVVELLEARSAVYEQIQTRIDTTNLTPDEVADALVSLYVEQAQLQRKQGNEARVR